MTEQQTLGNQTRQPAVTPLTRARDCHDRRRLGALAALFVLAACPQRQPAEVQADAGASPLQQKLASLNHCTRDEDCWDLGFVPGIGCHVPVRAAPGVAARTNEAIDADPEAQRFRESCAFERGDSAAPRCRIQCPRFFGFECKNERCLSRFWKPDRDICTINEAPVDCGEVLDRLRSSPAFDCLRVCDGGHEGGARVQVVADGETSEGKKSAERLVIDYLRCSSCARSAWAMKNARVMVILGMALPALGSEADSVWQVGFRPFPDRSSEVPDHVTEVSRSADVQGLGPVYVRGELAGAKVDWYSLWLKERTPAELDRALQAMATCAAIDGGYRCDLEGNQKVTALVCGNDVLVFGPTTTASRARISEYCERAKKSEAEDRADAGRHDGGAAHAFGVLDSGP